MRSELQRRGCGESASRAEGNSTHPITGYPIVVVPLLARRGSHAPAVERPAGPRQCREMGAIRPLFDTRCLTPGCPTAYRRSVPFALGAALCGRRSPTPPAWGARIAGRPRMSPCECARASAGATRLAPWSRIWGPRCHARDLPARPFSARHAARRPRVDPLSRVVVIWREHHALPPAIAARPCRNEASTPGMPRPAAGRTDRRSADPTPLTQPATAVARSNRHAPRQNSARRRP